MRNRKCCLKGRLRGALVLAVVATMLLMSGTALADGWHRRIVAGDTALDQLGEPYVWGAEGPDSFDCSGLVKYCYLDAGFAIGSYRTAAQFWSICDQVPMSQLQPGDLVFRNNFGHVGIYVGSGQVIHSPQTGDVVRFTTATAFDYGGRFKEAYWPNGDRTYTPPQLAVGDFNGDRKKDLAMLAAGEDGASTLYFFRSDGNMVANPTAWWSTSTGWDAGNSKMVAGDFNGDRKDDLAFAYDYGGSRTKIWVWLSSGSGFTSRSVWWDSGPGGWDWNKTTLVAGDFNEDAKDDLLLAYDLGTRTKLWVFESGGSGFPLSGRGIWWDSGSYTWRMSNTRLAAGDFDADGDADLALLYGYGADRSKVWVFRSNGYNYFSQRGIWWDSVSQSGSWPCDRLKMVAGDINSDGDDDLTVIRDNSGTTEWWSIRSNRSAFSYTRRLRSDSTWDFDRIKVGMGNVNLNYDDDDDLIMVYDLEAYNSSDSLPDTRVWTWRTNGDDYTARVYQDWWNNPYGAWWRLR